MKEDAPPLIKMRSLRGAMPPIICARAQKPLILRRYAISDAPPMLMRRSWC